jgi:DNA-binding transcriptional MocR family regulator
MAGDAAEPASKKAKVAQAQDFIKGWPSPDLLTQPELKDALTSSFRSFVENTQMFLNYGDAQNGAYMLGTPVFRKTLAEFLSKQYGKDVDWNCVMSTGGSSMGTDIAIRIHSQAGDYAVSEAPTYYLAHEMMRNRGLNLLEVPLQEDGMDMDALEKVLSGEHKGKIKLVYTVCVHHNPTGVTMSNAKRERLLKLAKQYDFKIIADEAYQLLNFAPSGVSSMFYHDDPADPRVLAIGTFSKLIGPGVKVGWVQAHPQILKPLINIGFIDSGNNPAIMSSGLLNEFIASGALAKHIDTVSKKLCAKKDLLVSELKDRPGAERSQGGLLRLGEEQGEDDRTERQGHELEPTGRLCRLHAFVLRVAQRGADPRGRGVHQAVECVKQTEEVASSRPDGL